MRNVVTGPPKGRVRMSRTLQSIILGYALTSCTAGPDWVPPATPKVTGYTARTLPGETTATAGTHGSEQRFVTKMDIPAQWWTLFQSAALNSVIEQALKNSPSVQSAQVALDANTANVTLQKVLAYPDLSASALAAREKLSISTTGAPTVLTPFSLATAALLITYQVDLFGERRRIIESTEAKAEAARFRLEATYLTLASNVAVAAIEEASLRAQVSALRDVVAADATHIQLLKQEVAQGNTARSSVLALETQFAKNQTDLITLEKALEQHRNALTKLTGQFPDKLLPETFSLDALTLPADLPVSLPSQLVQQRPDVRAAEAYLHAANAAIGIVEARMFPQITLGGAYGAATTSIPGVNDTAWVVQSTANIPITGVFAMRHQRKIAKAERDQAEATYKETVIGAFHDVSNALLAIDWDAKALHAAATAEQAASQQLTLMEKQYGAGETSRLALMETERAHLQARMNLAKAQAARFSDVVALYQALGGGWWNRPKVEAP